MKPVPIGRIHSRYATISKQKPEQCFTNLEAIPMQFPKKVDRLLYTIKEAQYLLSCSRVTLHRYVKSGALRPTKLGRAVRFTPEAILEFVAKRQA
jgi:excisionase family DNA binding protein